MIHPTTFTTAKNKLYVFLDKRRNYIAGLMIASFFLTLFNVNNEVLTKILVLVVLVPCLWACYFLEWEGMERRHQGARQLLKDQRDSSSPHWDGQIRYAQDIEPRLQLLKARVLQDQLEIKSIQIAKEQNKL